MRKLYAVVFFTVIGVNVNAQCSAAAGPISTICLGQSTAQLSASSNPAAVSYSWTPSAGLSCTNCPNPIANPGFSNTYTVYTKDANNCTASAVVSVSVGAIPFVSAIAPTTICAGDSTTLNANTQNGQAPYSYYWSPSNALNNPNLQNPIAGNVTTTIYTVTVTDVFGCHDDTSTIVYVQTKPTATFCSYSVSGHTVTYCANVSSNTQMCYWDFGDGTNLTTYPPNINPPPHTYPWGGAYNACLFVFNPPCRDSVCETITILGVDEYNLSSLIDISPNPTSGKINLQINGLGNVQMKIYNIYGECIYQQICTSANQLVDLSKQPAGIYFLKIFDQDGSSAVKKIIKE